MAAPRPPRRGPASRAARDSDMRRAIPWTAMAIPADPAFSRRDYTGITPRTGRPGAKKPGLSTGLSRSLKKDGSARVCGRPRAFVVSDTGDGRCYGVVVGAPLPALLAKQRQPGKRRRYRNPLLDPYNVADLPQRARQPEKAGAGSGTAEGWIELLKARDRVLTSIGTTAPEPTMPTFRPKGVKVRYTTAKPRRVDRLPRPERPRHSSRSVTPPGS
jgi:hypothetical protein